MPASTTFPAPLWRATSSSRTHSVVGRAGRTVCARCMTDPTHICGEPWACGPRVARPDAPSCWTAVLPGDPRYTRGLGLGLGSLQRSSTPRIHTAMPEAHLVGLPEPDDRLLMWRYGSAASRAQLPVAHNRQPDGVVAPVRHNRDPSSPRRYRLHNHCRGLEQEKRTKYLTRVVCQFLVRCPFRKSVVEHRGL